MDNDYCFSFINIGANGRYSNGSIFQSSPIFNDLKKNMLPGGFLVEDASFPLKTYLLKPYHRSPLTY